MQPPRVDLLAVVRERATRYLSELPGHVAGEIVQGDSRLSGSYADVRFSFVITSPPYFGMRTYIPDQWLRNWFMGGPSYVEYCQSKDEVSHKSAREFAAQLKSVWEHAASHSADDGFMLIRFGGINDRKAEPLEILRSSLANTAWRIKTIRNAGDANHGRRQAKQFGGNQKSPLVECDLYATLN